MASGASAMAAKAVRDSLLRAAQRGRSRFGGKPIVNTTPCPWPVPPPPPLGLAYEELEYFVEHGQQGWVPVRIVRPADRYNDPHYHAPPAPAPAEAAAPSASPSQLDASLQLGAADSAAPSASAAGSGGGAAAVASRAAEPPSAAGAAAAEGDGAEGEASPSEPPPLRRPVMIFLHATGESMDAVRHKQELYARMGYVAVAIDARYHGRRALVPHEVTDALNRAAAGEGGGSGPGAARVSASASAASIAGAPAAATPAAVPSTATVAAVKRLNAKTLSALDRADAAAGLGASSTAGGGSGRNSPTPHSSASASSLGGAAAAAAALATGVVVAPAVGPRTAALAAEAAKAAAAHERFVGSWVQAIEELRKRRGGAVTAAVLATAPPPPPPLTPDGTRLDAAAAVAARERSNAARGRGAAVAAGASDTPRRVYEAALVAAWRGSGERPFLLDTVWDLVLLIDLLVARPDVDARHIGVTGVSLGGMFAWLLAVADERVAAVAPVIGVQGFMWALENDAFQGRVDSIPLLFEVAASDLGKEKADAEVVRAVWVKLLPGLVTDWDSPKSLSCIAPRPLLVANGELDPRCPLPGVHAAMASARATYEEWAKGERAKQLEAEASRAAAAEAPTAGADAAAVDAGAPSAQASGSIAPAGEASAGVAAEASGGFAAPAVQGSVRSLQGGGEASASDGVLAADRSATLVPGAESSLRSLPGAHMAPMPTEPADPSTSASSDAAAGAGPGGAVGAADEGADTIQAEGEAEGEGKELDNADAAEAAATAAERAEAAALAAMVGTRLQLYVEAGGGHSESLRMQRAVQEWMQRHVLDPWRRGE